MLTIRCDQCEKEFKLNLQATPLPAPYTDVAEMSIECPHCGYRKASHYMSPALIQKQLELRRAAILCQQNRTRLNIRRLIKVKQEYGQLFDAEQKKYVDFLNKNIVLSLEKVGDDHGAGN